jgi:hypothetical protein
VGAGEQSHDERSNAIGYLSGACTPTTTLRYRTMRQTPLSRCSKKKAIGSGCNRGALHALLIERGFSDGKLSKQSIAQRDTRVQRRSQIRTLAIAPTCEQP